MGGEDEAAGRTDGIAGGGAVEVFRTQLTALNNSGVAGDAVLVLDRAAHALDVDIEARGLEPGHVHPQHIHGFTDGRDARTPGFAQDADGDGFVELAEGLVKYGPIQLNLTLNPEDSQHDHGTDGHDHTAAAMFPTADAEGNLNYAETFRFDRSDPNAQAIFDGITPLEAKEIVLHGLTVREGEGAGTGLEVDGSGGYKQILPVASGELQDVTDAFLAAGAGGSADWHLHG